MVAGTGLEPISGILVDLDFLKEINDIHGHGAGDVAIKALATGLRQEDGLAGRFGGDEFGLLLPGRNLQDVVSVGESLRLRLSKSQLEAMDSLQLTCSVGVAQRVADETVDEVLARTDLAL